MSALWESESFRRVAGNVWRPGGTALTVRGLELCRELCGLAPGQLVLDLGCGCGATMGLLQKAGYRVLGLDRQMQPDAASLADSGAIQIIQADMARLPFAANCAEALVCECVLSLLAAPQAFLHQCLRVLRPGGVLLFSDLTRREPESPATGGTNCNSEEGFTGCIKGLPKDSAPDFFATPQGGSSCMDGARPAAQWGRFLQQAGFLVVHYEDHTRALVELAARMVWYGDAGPENKGASDGCTCMASGGRRKYGYGLWIAQKEKA